MNGELQHEGLIVMVVIIAITIGVGMMFYLGFVRVGGAEGTHEECTRGLSTLCCNLQEYCKK